MWGHPPLRRRLSRHTGVREPHDVRPSGSTSRSGRRVYVYACDGEGEAMEKQATRQVRRDRLRQGRPGESLADLSDCLRPAARGRRASSATSTTSPG